MKERRYIETGRRAFLKGTAIGVVDALASPAQIGAGAKPLRVGVIGVGLRGTFLTGSIAKLAEQGEPVEIVAVCDIYQPRLERAQTVFKAKGFHNSSDMLREVPLDAVFIATPDRHHLPNLLEAIRAGKDVYCEKPICHWTQFDRLKAVVRENRKYRRIIQVGTQFIADSVWEKSGALLRGGAIGKPVHAQTGYFRHGDQAERGMRIDDPNARPGVGVDWEKFQADAPRHEFSVSRLFRWRLYMDYSGGPLTDTNPHMLTPLYKVLAPGMPEKVVAVGGRHYYDGEREVPDTFDLLIAYPQGLTVVFPTTYVNNTGIDTVVRGSEGTMIKGPDAMLFEPQPGSTKARQEVPCDVLTRNKGHADLAVLHIKDFLQAVRTRRQPRSDLELAYTVQVPLIMAMQSHLENRVVFFDADREIIRLG